MFRVALGFSWAQGIPTLVDQMHSKYQYRCRHSFAIYEYETPGHFQINLYLKSNSLQKRASQHLEGDTFWMYVRVAFSFFIKTGSPCLPISAESRPQCPLYRFSVVFRLSSTCRQTVKLKQWLKPEQLAYISDRLWSGYPYHSFPIERHLVRVVRLPTNLSTWKPLNGRQHLYVKTVSCCIIGKQQHLKVVCFYGFSNLKIYITK